MLVVWDLCACMGVVALYEGNGCTGGSSGCSGTTPGGVPHAAIFQRKSIVGATKNQQNLKGAPPFKTEIA